MDYSVYYSKVKKNQLAAVRRGVENLLEKHCALIGTDSLVVIAKEQSKIVIYPRVGQIEAVIPASPNDISFCAADPSGVGFSLNGISFTIKYKQENS